MLSELIKELHSLRNNLHQATLSGDMLEEEKFQVLGFVPVYIIELKEDIWYKKLDSERIATVEEHLSRLRYNT